MALLPTTNEILSDKQNEQIDYYIEAQQRDEQDITYLNYLMQHYMLKVPFENISVQNKEEIDLTLEGLFNKIINHSRGGYCYEMNTFFKHYLLKKSFKVYNTSATIISPKGRSREGSHMTTIVELDNKRYIADVGFGDLPMQAILIGTEASYQEIIDVNGVFRAIQTKDRIFVQKRIDGEFKTKYEARIQEQKIESFKDNIEFNQYNPESIFVKGLLITMPTLLGRKTMTYRNLTVTEDEDKSVTTITKDNYQQVLLQQFGLDMKLNKFESELK